MNILFSSRTLSNGLVVAVAENHEEPVAGVCVLYKVGSRREPRGRSGFAHLFEHLMFEGTPRVPKGVFDRVCEASGGSNNGQTRPDTTIYLETAPVNALSRLLWLEADRMKHLAFSDETLENQREVVKEEIRVNVQNDPYGLFEYGELPQQVFDSWENAHDGYGDFADLEAASLDDVRAFYEAFYRPNNAVVAVAGAVEAAEVFELCSRLFEDIPPRPLPPHPDLFEAKRAGPALVFSPAPLAKTPALAAGWRMPPRDHPDALPLLVLGELLHEGRTGRLHKGLVEGREIATEVSGGFNPFQGGPWYEGTTLFLTKIAFRREVPAERVLEALDEEVASVVGSGVPEAELERVKTRLRTQFVAALESRLDLAVEMAQATAFDGRPQALLELPGRVEALTSGDVRRAAAAWLDAPSRAVVVKKPSAPEPQA